MTEPASEVTSFASTNVRPETRHEAHVHAHQRVLWGIAAVVVVMAGFLVWFKWGAAIKDVCVSELEDGCALDLGAPSEGGATFDRPDPVLYK